jgi:cell volume regulation protein A
VYATLPNPETGRRGPGVLEAETGLNDPVAIAMTLGLISWIQTPRGGFLQLATEMLRQLGLGLLAGLAFAAMAAWVFARLPASIGPFAPVASVAIAALSFGTADVIGGSGFLAVYLVGLSIGSTRSPFRRQVLAFHEGLAFLAQVTLFIVLGLLVFPHQLAGVAGAGLALAVLLVVVVRPVAVWLSTALGGFTARERILLGWAGLRGAAPIVLATFALSSGLTKANTIFNAVFFVVVVSTLLQGTTLERLARRLRLVDPRPNPTAAPLAVDALGPLQLAEFDIAGDHVIANSTVSELRLPQHALIAVIARGADTIPPRGSTVIHAGDRLYVLNPRSQQPELDAAFSRWRRQN